MPETASIAQQSGFAVWARLGIFDLVESQSTGRAHCCKPTSKSTFGCAMLCHTLRRFAVSESRICLCGRPNCNPLQRSAHLMLRMFCPGPSSLNRPHPSHSQAHRDFTARRLIRNAFAVRERLGDPQVVPSFRCSFLPDMPSSLTPGSSIIVTCPEFRCRRGLRRELTGSTLPTLPQSDSRGRPISWLHWFTTATACQIACPPGRI